MKTPKSYHSVVVLAKQSKYGGPYVSFHNIVVPDSLSESDQNTKQACKVSPSYDFSYTLKKVLHNNIFMLSMMSMLDEMGSEQTHVD